MEMFEIGGCTIYLCHLENTNSVNFLLCIITIQELYNSKLRNTLNFQTPKPILCFFVAQGFSLISFVFFAIEFVMCKCPMAYHPKVKT